MVLIRGKARAHITQYAKHTVSSTAGLTFHNSGLVLFFLRQQMQVISRFITRQSTKACHHVTVTASEMPQSVSDTEKNRDINQQYLTLKTPFVRVCFVVQYTEGPVGRILTVCELKAI